LPHLTRRMDPRLGRGTINDDRTRHVIRGVSHAELVSLSKVIAWQRANAACRDDAPCDGSGSSASEQRSEVNQEEREQSEQAPVRLHESHQAQPEIPSMPCGMGFGYVAIRVVGRRPTSPGQYPCRRTGTHGSALDRFRAGQRECGREQPAGFHRRERCYRYGSDTSDPLGIYSS
jgi:hypothetical protein